jgi:hypothetical protein
MNENLPANPVELPRFVPDEPLPPYTFVPGQQPHPFSDPRGHSFGRVEQPPPSPDPAHWAECRAFLRGIDLFNRGYYWEAHEAWEGLWHACGRTGDTATLLKGLIHLAAAGVKVREGRPAGVRSHADKARHHFEQLRQNSLLTTSDFWGLNLGDLSTMARQIAVRAEERPAHSGVDVVIVFPVSLQPGASPP